VQRKIDEINILIELDDEQRDKSIATDRLLGEIRESYQKLVGNTVMIKVKDVERVEDGTSPSLIISKLTKKRIEEMLF